MIKVIVTEKPKRDVDCPFAKICGNGKTECLLRKGGRFVDTTCTLNLCYECQMLETREE